MIRPSRVALAAALSLTLGVGGAAGAAASPPSGVPEQSGAAAAASPDDVTSWAADTWRSMAAMADEHTGLPAVRHWRVDRPYALEHHPGLDGPRRR